MQCAREFQPLSWGCGAPCSAAGATCVEDIRGACAPEILGDPRYDVKCTVQKVVVQRQPQPKPMLGWLTGHREMLYVEIGDNRVGKTGARRTGTGYKVEPDFATQSTPSKAVGSGSVVSSPSASPKSFATPPATAARQDVQFQDHGEVWTWDESKEGAPEGTDGVGATVQFSITLSSDVRLRVLASTQSSVQDATPVSVLGEARFQMMNDVLPAVKTDGLLTGSLVEDNRVIGQVWFSVDATSTDGVEQQAARGGWLRRCDLPRGANNALEVENVPDVPNEPVYTLNGHTGPVTCCQVFPDGDRILTASADTIAIIWSKNGDQITKLIGHNAPIMSCEVAQSGDEVVTVSEDHVAILWRISGLKATQLLEIENVRISAISPDSNYLTVAGSGNNARLVARRKSVEHTILKKHTQPVSALLILPSNDSVTFSLDGDGVIWSDVGKLMRQLRGHQASIMCCAMFPDGDRVITGSDDQTAIVWSVLESSRSFGKAVAILRGHTKQIQRCAVFPSGERVVTAAADNTCIVWSSSGEKLANLDGHNDVVSGCRGFFAGEDYVITVSHDGRGIVWSLSGVKVGLLQGHEGQIMACAVFPNGSHVVTAGEKTVSTVWSVAHCLTPPV